MSVGANRAICRDRAPCSPAGAAAVALPACGWLAGVDGVEAVLQAASVVIRASDMVESFMAKN
jgi:hypothetical protein